MSSRGASSSCCCLALVAGSETGNQARMMHSVRGWWRCGRAARGDGPRRAGHSQRHCRCSMAETVGAVTACGSFELRKPPARVPLSPTGIGHCRLWRQPCVFAGVARVGTRRMLMRAASPATSRARRSLQVACASAATEAAAPSRASLSPTRSRVCLCGPPAGSPAPSRAPLVPARSSACLHACCLRRPLCVGLRATYGGSPAPSRARTQ